MTNEPLSQLAELIAEWMPMLDQKLSESRIPLHNRVIHAAQLFVHHAILEIQGDDKNNLFSKTWFRDIYQSVLRWYQHKYGNEFNKQHDNILTGVCLYSQVAFNIEVPRTLTKVEKEGEASWLIFPASVQDWEDPLKWISRPPNFAGMVDRELQTLKNQVARTGILLRRIYIDLMTAEKADPILEGLGQNVLTHIQASAGYISDPYQNNLGLACWEAHQSVEKSLKFLARQKLGEHKKSHNLGDLRSYLENKCSIFLDLPDFNLIPDDKQIIALRSSEDSINDIENVYNIYQACLSTSAICCASAERKYVIPDSRFLLKKPEFI